MLTCDPLGGHPVHLQAPLGAAVAAAAAAAVRGGEAGRVAQAEAGRVEVLLFQEEEALHKGPEIFLGICPISCILSCQFISKTG